jgi:hypothetical protein
MEPVVTLENLNVALQDGIAALPISGRALKALRRLKIRTVLDFLVLNIEDIPPLRNCGVVTINDLETVQRKLRSRLPAGTLTFATAPAPAPAQSESCSPRSRTSSASTINMSVLPTFAVPNVSSYRRH